MRHDSPCVSVCRLDNDNRCVGCKRTIEEIRRWSDMTKLERHEILEQLKTR